MLPVTSMLASTCRRTSFTPATAGPASSNSASSSAEQYVFIVVIVLSPCAGGALLSRSALARTRGSNRHVIGLHESKLQCQFRRTEGHRWIASKILPLLLEQLHVSGKRATVVIRQFSWRNGAAHPVHHRARIKIAPM